MKLSAACTALTVARRLVAAERGVLPDADRSLASPTYDVSSGGPSAPNPGAGVLKPDVGYLSRGLQGELECFVDVVECVAGNAGNQTCEDACEGECCVGSYACDGFTGTVCRDGYSCFGDNACRLANITEVIAGCHGKGACFYAGAGGGSIGMVYGSCAGGDYACFGAAFEEGSIGDVVESCQGYNACRSVARGGKVGSILASCSGDYACDYAAEYGGDIGALQYSCVGGNHSCDSLAYRDGSIESILFSCRYGYYVCGYMGSYGGHTGDISYSCSDERACYRAAACESEYRVPTSCTSYIDEVSNSCIGIEACARAAYENGGIALIDRSCQGEGSCRGAGEGGVLPYGMTDCCRGELACEGATEETLPGDCRVPPTAGPTTSPTTSPTESGPPTGEPTADPTEAPTASTAPTLYPTARPSNSPVSVEPTESPTVSAAKPLSAKSSKAKSSKAKSSKTTSERAPKSETRKSQGDETPRNTTGKDVKGEGDSSTDATSKTAKSDNRGRARDKDKGTDMCRGMPCGGRKRIRDHHGAAQELDGPKATAGT